MANIYEKIHRALSWKRIIAFNVLLFLVTAVPLSVRLAQEEADNRSGAALPVPSVVPPAAYPAGEPRIDRVSEFFGKKGDTVVILGSNYGDYQWDSKVYVGNVEAQPNEIVRWSNSIIEVQIPEGARTGKVWIAVNGKQATWEGSLLLYDVARSAEVGIRKINNNRAVIWVSNGTQIIRGIAEIGHVGEIAELAVNQGSVTAQNVTVDSMGKKTKIDFTLDLPLTSSATDIIAINHAGIGNIEILRIELYDQNNQLVPVYADPLGIKVVN